MSIRPIKQLYSRLAVAIEASSVEVCWLLQSLGSFEAVADRQAGSSPFGLAWAAAASRTCGRAVDSGWAVRVRGSQGRRRARSH